MTPTTPGPLPPGALEPTVEIRIVEHHPVASVEWPDELVAPSDLDMGRILQRHDNGEVLLAEYRGNRAAAAGLMRRLADELDPPRRLPGEQGDAA